MPPVFVLTIDAPRGPRRQHCTALFKALAITFDFVDGILPNEALQSGVYSPLRNFLKAKRSLTPEEIAVYLGHRKIWKMIVTHGIDVALVVEDDLAVTDPDAFGTALNHASDHAAWDILKLFDFAPKPVVKSHRWNGLTIVDYKYPASGCVAYLITKEAAEKLLQRERIFRQVDEDLSWCWEFGLIVRSLMPNVVVETSHTLGGSLLEDKRRAIRGRKSILRSVIGMVIAGIKQVRARCHLARILRAG